MGNGGRRLETIRLNIVSKEKLLAPILAWEVALRTWAIIFRIFLHFLKSPQFFLSAIIKFRKCMRDVARCPC